VTSTQKQNSVATTQSIRRPNRTYYTPIVDIPSNCGRACHNDGDGRGVVYPSLAWSRYWEAVSLLIP
jgi:hypothetical protein